VDFLKKDDEITGISSSNQKDDEISSDCNQIKIRTQSDRITFKFFFQFNKF
jgi:hypothetical protein